MNKKKKIFKGIQDVQGGEYQEYEEVKIPTTKELWKDGLTAIFWVVVGVLILLGACSQFLDALHSTY